LHEAFESHLDRYGPGDSEVLNLGPACFAEPLSVAMQVPDAPGTLEHVVVKRKDGTTYDFDLTLEDYV
jgi:hypothetical protein